MALRTLDGVLIKRANKVEKFTDSHASELAKCLDPETGYLHFLRNYFYIQHPIRGKIPFIPFDFQLKILNAYHKYRHTIIMAARQGGKCVTYDTKIKIKHAITNEEREITIGEFFDQICSEIESEN